MSNREATAAAENLHDLAGEAKELLKDTEHVATSKAKEARDRLMAAIESAKVTCKKLEDKAVAGAKATDQAIRTHPYESMAIAFGLGIIVGLLVRRK